MIAIKNFPVEKYPLYSPKDELIEHVDYFQFNDVRIQIKEQHLEGYYVLFNKDGQDRKIMITPDGGTDSYPSGFYSLIDDQLDRLLDLV
jgi:hypothetical protein